MEFFPSRAVALSVAGFSIHWYGLLYLAGFLIGAWLLPILGKYRSVPLSRDQWMELLSWAVVGVIAGGRLGYILFYEPAYYVSQPLKILALWEGGMSFHGGLVGVLTVMYVFCRKKALSLLQLGDVVVVPVAIGLMLGRFGNFLNQELYGVITTLPWGMQFEGAEGLRHPTQLYAMLKDAVIAMTCFVHLQKTVPGRPYGRTGAQFLILYGVGRFLIEFVRVPTHSSIDLEMIVLTRGELLTIPVFLLGIAVWIYTMSRGRV